MIVLDTSVIIEYIDLEGRFHEQAKIVFNAINWGKIRAYIPHPILAETYYVSERIYRSLNIEKPQIKAEKLVEWLYSHPNINIVANTLDLALEAGKTKQKLRIALTDSYVLATSKIKNAKAIFRVREREMKKALDEIEKNYKVIFLEDF